MISAGMQWVANNRAKPCVVLLTASINQGGKTIDAAAEALVDAGCVVVAKAAPIRKSGMSTRACDFSPGRSHRVSGHFFSATSISNSKISLHTDQR